MTELNEIYLAFFSVIILFFIIGFGIYLIRSTLRRKQMESLAKSLQLSFKRQEEVSFFPGLKQSPLFSTGHAKKIRNIVYSDQNSIKEYIFNYSYRTTKTNTNQTGEINLFEHTIIYFYLKNNQLPSFTLRSRQFGEKDQPHFIKFPTSRYFNKHYVLQSSDKKEIEALFSSEVINFFESEKRWNVRISGNKIMFYKKAYINSKSILKAYSVVRLLVSKYCT